MSDDAVVYYADSVHPTHNSVWVERGNIPKPPPSMSFPIMPVIAIIGELKECVEGTKIRQSPYSPNLNLIERLWKFFRKEVINTGFYRTKEKFSQVIRNFFGNVGKFTKKS